MNKEFFKNFDKLFVGMDQLFENAGSIINDSQAFVSTYPPYDVLKIDNGYQIRLAVAGYSLDNIEVLVDKKVLTINGTRPTSEDSNLAKFLHAGLSKRNFTKKFLLSQDIDKNSIEAALKDGILTITLTNLPQEDEKARKVKVKG